MATNNDGIGGVQIEHIAVEKSTLIGIQSPNTLKCIKQDDQGSDLPTTVYDPITGAKVKGTKGYDCKYMDVSWLNYGGKYTLGVGNRWNVRVGSGGIYTETTGPLLYSPQFVLFLSKSSFTVCSKLVELLAKERILLLGKRLDINFGNIVVCGNTNFLNNVSINGGLYVNGELICSHITTQRTNYTTESGGKIKGYINPSQSFHLFQGASILAKTACAQASLGTVVGALDVSDADQKKCWIDAEMVLRIDWLTQMIPGMSAIEGLFSVPIKLKFPSGVSMISDATAKIDPSAYPKFETIPRLMGGAVELPDITGPEHTHTYKGPTCSFKNGTSELYKEGAKIQEETPMKHKQNIADGCESWQEFRDELIKSKENQLKDYLTQTAKNFSPIPLPF